MPEFIPDYIQKVFFPFDVRLNEEFNACWKLLIYSKKRLNYNQCVLPEISVN